MVGYRSLSRGCSSGFPGRCYAGWKVWRFITGRDGVFRIPHALRREEDQADRAISKAQLHALLHFHMPPIDVVVYHGS